MKFVVIFKTVVQSVIMNTYISDVKLQKWQLWIQNACYSNPIIENNGMQIWDILKGNCDPIKKYEYLSSMR